MGIKHFELAQEYEFKKVGRYPQAGEFIHGYDPMSENGIFKIPRLKLPSFVPNLDGIKLHKRAKLTDVISAIMFSRGLMIHKRVAEILNDFNLCKHKIFKAKLYQNDIVLEDYYVILAEFDILPYVDYEKTEFYSYHGPSVKYLEKIYVPDAESYLKIDYELINGPEGTYVYSLEHKDPIYLIHDFPEDLDYFIASFFAFPIISERLKIALEEAKVTGVRYKNLEKKLIFQ